MGELNHGPYASCYFKRVREHLVVSKREGGGQGLPVGVGLADGVSSSHTSDGLPTHKANGVAAAAEDGDHGFLGITPSRWRGTPLLGFRGRIP